MVTKHSHFRRDKFWLMKAIGAVIGKGITVIIIACVAAILLFPDVLMNKFIKPRVQDAFDKAYPNYSLHIKDMNYSTMQKQIEFHSIILTSNDGSFSGKIGSLSISKINWMNLIFGESIDLNDFSSSILAADNIILTFKQSGYEYRCERFQLSIPDSEIVAETITLQPLAGDEQFFRKSNFQRTRFIFVIQQCAIKGVSFITMVEEKKYYARSVRLHEIFFDVLVNNDKPHNKNSPNPLMPNEIFASIREDIKIDTLRITNGQLIYGERLSVGSKPAVITFDSLQLGAGGIANNDTSGSTVFITAQGKFMENSAMKIRMEIPIDSPVFSFQCYGSVNKLNLKKLNSFLEIAEQIRIKDGFLYSSTFQINVDSGIARGTVRTVYKDLTISYINSKTGSENGFSNSIKSFLANNVVIRRSNIPDKSGAVKVGEVKYSRKHNDPFFRFAWFSIRSGVKDVVGF